VVAGTNSAGQPVVDTHTRDHYRAHWKMGYIQLYALASSHACGRSTSSEYLRGRAWARRRQPSKPGVRSSADRSASDSRRRISTTSPESVTACAPARGRAL